AFAASFSKLRRRFDKDPPGCDVATLDRALGARSFEDVYKILDFTHVIQPDGSLAALLESAFSAVFSMHVLEHVRREAVPELIRQMYRVLKPGGVAVHQIGIDDHFVSLRPKGLAQAVHLVFGTRMVHRV